MPTNTLAAKKASDSKFDILKLVLSFFVVAIHSALFPMVLYPWLRVAVPLFFIMTGYFFFQKLNQTDDYATQLKMVKGFVVRNIKLYAFWFVCLLPLILYIRKDIYFGHGVINGILAFLKGVLFSGTFTASWYIVASIYGVLIIFFLLRKIPNGVLFALAIFLYIIVSLTSSYKSVIFKSDVVEMAYDVFCTYIEVPATSFLVAVAWLICGKCFADGTFKNSKLIYGILTVVFGVALYIEWRFVLWLDGTFNNDCYLMLMPFCIGIFGFLNSCKAVTFKYSVAFRRCSTVVFVFHGAAGRVTSVVFRKVIGVDSIPLCYVSSIIICICVYLLIEFVLHHCRNNRLGKILRYAY